MKRMLVALILGVFSLIPVCRAENPCPWINKATALGALGASEDAPTADATGTSDSVCSFFYRDGTITRELRITVEHAQDSGTTFIAYRARCGTDLTSLRAIGNETVMCALSQKGRAEMVVGRVRDKLFTVSISTSSARDPLISHDALIERARLVAEQVSGSLF